MRDFVEIRQRVIPSMELACRMEKQGENYQNFNFPGKVHPGQLFKGKGKQYQSYSKQRPLVATRIDVKKIIYEIY